MLNLCRAALKSDVLPASGFADTVKNSITVWNDDETEKRAFLRSHMIHAELVMCVGHGMNVLQKRNWNGDGLDGIKRTDREIRRRLRVVRFNDEHEVKFEEPIFDKETGTFKVGEIGQLQGDDLKIPLLPAVKNCAKRTIIK